MCLVLRNLLFSTSVIFMFFSFCPGAESDPNTETNINPDQKMEWWQNAKFGIFISWNPSSLTGMEMGWSRGGRRAGFPEELQPKAGEAIPAYIYDNLYKQFDPILFNARQWIQNVKESGAKYIIFTTKHHDGFCFFDTKLTDYKITSPLSPFGRDITAELAKACQEAGIKIFWYYSPTDWYHPDFCSDNHARYVEYMHGQLKELCSNYGKIDGIWFDNQTPTGYDTEKLFSMIRSFQPNIIINNRCGSAADFDTPEGVVGRFQIDRPWESCIPMGTQWSWRSQDKLKSSKECITTIVQCAGGGGNLALDIAPMPDGRIEQRQVDRLKQIGQWLEKYGQTIYGTHGGPFKPCKWAASTYRDNNIFLHLFGWRDGEVKLPPINNKIISARLLTGGKMEFRQSDTEILFSIPQENRHDIDTIVEITIDGSAKDIVPVNLSSGSLAFAKSALASSTYNTDFSVDKAFDDDDSTRWAAADSNDAQQSWLEVDFGQQQTISIILISEFGSKIQSYELQQEVENEWKTFHSGTTIGIRHTIVLPIPVTAQKIRLNILKSSENSPSIYELQLFDSQLAELWKD